MSIIGLREQTVHGAKSIAEASERHRWNIPADYNVAVDCFDRHTDLRGKPALYYVLGHNGIDYSYNFLRQGDLYYSPADWAWAGGLLDGLLAIWPYGIPVLAYRSKARFDPDVTLKLLEKYGATVGLYPPTALKPLREREIQRMAAAKASR